MTQNPLIHILIPHFSLLRMSEFRFFDPTTFAVPPAMFNLAGAPKFAANPMADKDDKPPAPAADPKPARKLQQKKFVNPEREKKRKEEEKQKRTKEALMQAREESGGGAFGRYRGLGRNPNSNIAQASSYRGLGRNPDSNIQQGSGVGL